MMVTKIQTTITVHGQYGRQLTIDLTRIWYGTGYYLYLPIIDNEDVIDLTRLAVGKDRRVYTLGRKNGISFCAALQGNMLAIESDSVCNYEVIEELCRKMIEINKAPEYFSFNSARHVKLIISRQSRLAYKLNISLSNLQKIYDENPRSKKNRNA